MFELKVIPKREGKQVILFLPEMATNYGKIMCWNGTHNEASLEYYWSLRPHRDKDAVSRSIEWYEKSYICKLIRTDRDSSKMRQARWKKGEAQ